MTWDAFLKTNKEQYRVIRTSKDLEDVPEGIFLIVSTSMLGKLKRGLARFIKLRNRKLCLVFDESDENHQPQLTTDEICPLPLSQAEIQAARHGNHYTQQHIGTVQPIRVAV